MACRSPRAGRVHDHAHPAIGCPGRGRGRHLHRLLVAVHRPRARRPTAACCAATSARSGRRSRAALLGRGRGRRPDRRCGSARRRDAARRCPRAQQFDLAFIDADKPGYIDYYEAARAAAAAGRRDPGRQRALARRGRRSPTAAPTTSTAPSATSTTTSTADPRVDASCSPSATASPWRGADSPRAPGRQGGARPRPYRPFTRGGDVPSVIASPNPPHLRLLPRRLRAPLSAAQPAARRRASRRGEKHPAGPPLRAVRGENRTRAHPGRGVGPRLAARPQPAHPLSAGRPLPAVAMGHPPAALRAGLRRPAAPPPSAHETGTRRTVRRLLALYCRITGAELHLLFVDATPAEARRGQDMRGRRVSERSFRTHQRRWLALRRAIARDPQQAVPEARSLVLVTRGEAACLHRIDFTGRAASRAVPAARPVPVPRTPPRKTPVAVPRAIPPPPEARRSPGA